MSDVFAIQDEISRAIVTTLKIKLAGEPDVPLVLPQTENMEAYTLYLKGRYYWNKRYEVGLHRGLEFFQAAIAQDPGYALAYAGAADSFSVMGFYGYLPPAVAYAKAREAADQVMRLDPSLAEAHLSRGMIAFWHDWDWELAESSFRTALALRPRQAEIHLFLSQLFTMRGDFEGGVAEARRAQALDPVSPLITATAAWPFYVSGRYEEAVEQCTRALEIDPGFPVALWISALSELELGRFEPAVAAASKGVALSQRSTFLVSTLGCAHAKAGRAEEARKALDELRERATSGYVSPFHLAVIHACLGENDQALDALERAFKDRSPNLLTIATLPILRDVRELPRALALRRKMGL
jgi:serine/threonine-protein kinase